MGRTLEIGAATFAFIAAVFWFLSAYGKLPPMTTNWGAMPEGDPFIQAMIYAARMNTLAAIASGNSALLVAARLTLFPTR